MSLPITHDDIAALSLDERIELVEVIWDSIAEEAEELDIPQSHKEELDRRLAAYRANPRSGSTWAAVKARLADLPGMDS